MSEKGFRILFLQACDFYKERKSINGLTLPFIYEIDGKNKRLNKNFSSVFDYCLDMIKLNEISKTKVDKDLFDFEPYSTDIINVGFDLKHKDVSTKELRKWSYENGLVLNGKKYVRYKRSGGSSRKGQCLFILEELYKKMNKWSACGIDEHSSKVQNNLVSWEAYRALSLSGIQPQMIELNPNHILVVEDYKSVFLTEGIQVSIDNGNLNAKKSSSIEIQNTIWDGEGLLDVSLFTGDYVGKGMMLLRNRFFKSCVFNTNLQKWFKDNNITDISQLNGDTRATSIDQIKLVVTKSSIKYLKFGTLNAWRKNIDSLFGVVKTDKPTHFLEGQMVQTNYQMINTLNLHKNDMELLLNDSFDYLSKIQSDKDVLRYYVFQRSNKSSINNVVDEEDEYLSEDLYRDEVVLTLLKINKNFQYTKAYKDFKSKLQTSLREKLYLGKILVDGTYATLFGNGYELLQEIIGKFNHEKPSSKLNNGSIYIKFFQDDEELVCARSPHITMGNLYVVKNQVIPEYDKYFNLSKEIVVVNAINDNIQHRLNGCDYDSDTMLITNNNIILSKAKKHYNNFLVPVCTEEPDNKNDDLWEIDYEIKKNLVGETVNLSQVFNSMIWDEYNSNENFDCSNWYMNEAKLAVMSGMEIDKAKRKYDVSTSAVLKGLRKDARDVYPIFFKKLDAKIKQKHKEAKTNKKYKYYQTSMDYLYNIVENNELGNVERSKTIPIYEIANHCQVSGGNSSIQAARILEYAKETSEEIKNIRGAYASGTFNNNVLKRKIRFALESGMNKIKGELNNKYTIHLILKELEEDEYNECLWPILYFILKKNKNIFYEVFKTEDEYYEFKPSKSDFDLQLYSKKYKKCHKFNK